MMYSDFLAYTGYDGAVLTIRDGRGRTRLMWSTPLDGIDAQAEAAEELDIFIADHEGEEGVQDSTVQVHLVRGTLDDGESTDGTYGSERARIGECYLRADASGDPPLAEWLLGEADRWEARLDERRRDPHRFDEDGIIIDRRDLGEGVRA